MSMWTDMMAAEAAMREATALIEEQRAAIAALVAGLRDIESWTNAATHVKAGEPDLFGGEARKVNQIAGDLLLKHAPAQSQEP